MYVWSSALHATLPFCVLAGAVKLCVYGAVLCVHPCLSRWLAKHCIELCSAGLMHGAVLCMVAPSLVLEEVLVVVLGRWVVNGVVGNEPITAT